MVDVKQPTLRSQFLQVAPRAAQKDLLHDTQEELSMSLPLTPPYMQEGNEEEEISSASHESAHKKQKTDGDAMTKETLGTQEPQTVHAAGMEPTDVYYPLTFQRLTLPDWLVQQFQPDTKDPGLPPARIIRKDPVPRWACFSRVAPKLGHKVSGPVRPPYGIYNWLSSTEPVWHDVQGVATNFLFHSVTLHGPYTRRAAMKHDTDRLTFTHLNK